MISWIQRSFQRHFKVVFAVLLGVTIISFIITIGATPGIGRADHRQITRDFFGHNLASRGEMQQIESDAGLSVELQAGYSGLDEQQLQRYGLQRVAALHLADELRLPPATPAEEVDYIKGLRVFADEKGQFDPNRYETFRHSLQSSTQTSESDISRVIGDDARIQTVRQLLNGPGYILPADVQSAMNRADTTWTIGIATVDYTSFKPSIQPTEAELAKYYQDNSYRYQIPPRVLAQYVDYPAADYLGKVATTDAEVRAYYEAHRAEFPAPAPAAKKPVIKPDPNQDFAAVRAKVEAAVRLNKAKNLAAQAASDLAYALYQSKVPPGPALAKFLSARHLQPKPLAPFSQQAGPPELGGSPEIAAEGFRLDANQFFSEAVPTPSGAAVLIWKALLPARVPLLPEVRSKVLADYIDNQRRQQFVALGRTLHDEIAAYLKAGVPFEKAAAAAAAAQSVKIEAKMLPAFTMRNRPKELTPTVGAELEHLNQGQVSSMEQDADKGYLTYAAGKKAPAASVNSPQYAAMRSSIAGYMARLGANDSLGEMVDAELKRSEAALR